MKVICYHAKEEWDELVKRPHLDVSELNATVEGVIVKHGKGSKIKIFKYKPNTTSTRKKQGHRQPYTKVEIKKIG